MLADTIAIVVGLSSLYLLSTAFLAVDRHRKDDFLWGAVGLFYALALWLTADRVTGALLLGQVAAAALVLAFGWQTLKLRQALLYPDRPVLLFSVVDWLGGRLGKVAPLEPAKTPVPKAPEPSIEKVTEKVPETVPPVAEIIEPTVDETLETPIADDPAGDFEEFEEEPDFENNGTETWERGITRDDDLTEPTLRRVPPIGESEPPTGSESAPVASLTEITAILEEDSPPAPENPSETVISPDNTENRLDQN